MKIRLRYVVLAVPLIASLACNLALGAAQTPEVGAEVTTSSTSTDNSPVPSAEAPREPQTHAFGGYVNALYAGVADGRWTYEGGLIAGLESLAGLTPGKDLSTLDLGSLEGTGLIREADAYLADPSDPLQADRIRELVARIVPDMDRLEVYAAPEGTQSNRGQGLAAQAALDPTCADLWALGFPAGSQSTCFLYKEELTGSSLLRVYFPDEWVPGDPRRVYAQYAFEAAKKSLQTYGALGSVGNANVVFTLLPGDSTTTLAQMPTDNECLLIVYPKGMEVDQDQPGQSVANGIFKQTIAHEMGHCFQIWNMQPEGKQPWSVNDWWGEGSAEWLGNLVYPTVNYEWRWGSAFDLHSPDHSLFDLDYENFIFFQSMENQISATGVVSFLKMIPAGDSLDFQRTVVSDYPGMADIYDAFSHAYLDSLITDTGGALLPILVKIDGGNSISVKGSGGYDLAAPRFTLARYRMRFLNGRAYSLAETMSGEPGKHAARGVAAPGVWGDLPSQVFASCDQAELMVGLTSTDDSPGSYTTHLDIIQDKTIDCDKCLLGAWEMNKAELAKLMEANLSATSGFQTKGISGSWRYVFNSGGQMTGTFDHFDYAYSMTQGAAGQYLYVDVDLNLDGKGSALYWIEGDALHFNGSLEGVSFDQTILMNGQEISNQNLMEDAPFALVGESVPYTYTCDGAHLGLTVHGGSAQVGPYTFDRVGGQ